MFDREFIGTRRPIPSGTRFAVVISRYNAEFCDGLLAGCHRALAENDVGREAITVDYVPGAFELPLAAQWLARMSPPPGAVIALGTVIRGDTPHFDYVATVCLEGLSQVAQATGIPVTCGVLTVESRDQAALRSGNDDNNRGYQAAYAAFDMVCLRRAISFGTRPDL